MADIIDLSTLGSAGFIIQGDAAGDEAGYSVSDAGDVNGDGFADIILGTRHGDDGGTGAGEAYVIFGKAGGFGTIDLTGLAAPDGFIIQGDVANDYAGRSVSSAGDVNGDGFDDLIVGARGGDDGGFPRAGEAYVVFGKAEPFATVDLSTFVPAHPSHDPNDGFIIQGSDPYDQAGWSVSSAGDVNGDGLDDLIVGANQDNTGGYAAGAVYVIFGRASGFGTVDLTFLAADDDVGFTMFGDPNERAGWSVSSAGDIDGDGFDEIIVGAPGSGVAGAGAAYVLFGKASGFADIDLSSLAAADGFAIRAAAGFDNLGLSVSSAGDVNGDGLDDVIVASPETTNNANDGRTAYVVFGKVGGFVDVDLASLDPADGFSISVRTDATGNIISNVSSAGDVNGDGFDDVIVGEPGASTSIAPDDEGVGKSYVLYGKAVWDDVDLANLAAEDGFVIVGDSRGDRAGFSVSAAGDVNDDGFDDVVVGAATGDDGGTDAGEAYVVFGQAPTTGVTRTGSEAGQTIMGGDFNDILSGLGGNDLLLGGTGNDRLFGGTGNDRLDGGVGNDTAAYVFAAAGVTVRLARPTGQDTIGAGIDRLASIENAAGSAFADALTGTVGANRLDGGNGRDSLLGGGGNDRLFGDGGNDVLNGAAGRDRLDGGTGIDVVNYAWTGSAVTVNLARTTAQDTLGAGVDTLASIENAVGSAFADALTGTTGANRLDGAGGNDRLAGGRGNDRLFGANGNDRVDGGDGADTLAGNAGIDRLIGGRQRDTMAGGADADVFVFDDGATGASRAAADRITDFSHADGDQINLRLVDADTGTSGDQNFAFIGTGAFTDVAGQLRYDVVDGHAFVQGDINGDGNADFFIRLDNVQTIDAADFVI